MDRGTILEELKEIVFDYLGEELPVEEDSLLEDELGLTSLDMISIVGDVEETFDISIEDGEARRIETVADVLDYIEEKTHA